MSNFRVRVRDKEGNYQEIKPLSEELQKELGKNTLDETDIWRENLKAWNLKQREEIRKPTKEEF